MKRAFVTVLRDDCDDTHFRLRNEFGVYYGLEKCEACDDDALCNAREISSVPFRMV